MSYCDLTYRWVTRIVASVTSAKPLHDCLRSSKIRIGSFRNHRPQVASLTCILLIPLSRNPKMWAKYQSRFYYIKDFPFQTFSRLSTLVCNPTLTRASCRQLLFEQLSWSLLRWHSHAHHGLQTYLWDSKQEQSETAYYACLPASVNALLVDCARIRTWNRSQGTKSVGSI